MLFRTEAVRKLASPEELNEAIRVSSPMTLVLISVLLFAIGVALIWGVTGTIYTRVTGQAFIVYKNADTMEVISRGSGTLVDLNVDQGDRVVAGSVLGTVSNPDLTRRLEQARHVATLSQTTLKEYEASRKAELTELVRLQALQRTALEGRLDDSNKMAQSYEKRLESNKDLLARGVAILTTVDDLRSKYFQAREAVENARYQIAQLDLDREERATRWNKEILDQKASHSKLVGLVGDLEQELWQSETIRSPVDGEVSPILVTQGTHLNAGDTIFTIVKPNAYLDTLGFLSATKAKLIKPGMKVQISPSTVKLEEFGGIVGTVVEVSRFPMSGEALFAVLHNQELANTFLQGGAPLLVRIAMDRTQSGDLVWSSNRVPPFDVTAGTLANVSVTVRVQAPITLVLPTLRNWGGLR